MSHIVMIKTEIRDLEAIKVACKRLKLEAPKQGEFELFGTRETGVGVFLKDWKYPVVCQLESGQLKYDNYEGRWGHQDRLNELLQCYGVAKARIEARRRGHSVVEQLLSGGSVKLTVSVGGAA